MRIKKKILGRKVMILSILLLVIFLSCEDWISVPAPETELFRENIFVDDKTALAAISAVYGQLSNGSTSFPNSISIFEGAYADELTSYAPTNSSSETLLFYLNTLVPGNQTVSRTWSSCYNTIYSVNLLIEGLKTAPSITPSATKQILGEALFIRGFCHLYLTNLFGDIPLVTTSDYQVNSNVSRTSIAEVYEAIVADLLEAKNFLTDTYPSEGRVRPNKGAATALLARTYLYAGDYENAEIQATDIISNTSQYKLLTDLNAVFLKNSEEAIWQLLPNGGTQEYTFEGYTFILIAAPPTNVTLRNGLYNSFEEGDLRRTSWTKELTSSSGLSKWYYPFKYKENHLNATSSEYSMVLRVAEQYLIRAEARIHQNKFTGVNSAESDINIVRDRAGLPNITASTKDELLAAIEHERRVELFTEWGHRFFDLKRTGRLDAVMTSMKTNWNTYNQLLPIPQSEIQNNHNLRPQNPGY